MCAAPDEAIVAPMTETTYGPPLPPPAAPPPTRLERDPDDKVIAGVCAAIADRLGMSRTGVRLAFLISCVLPGPQFIAYIAGWLLIPKERW